MPPGASLAWEPWVRKANGDASANETDETQGIPMAKNLRAKIPEEDTMTVFDVNTAATQRLTEEADAKVHVASSPKEVAEMSVRTGSLLSYPGLLMNICSIDDLSWGSPLDLPYVILYQNYSQSSESSILPDLRLKTSACQTLISDNRTTS